MNHSATDAPRHPYDYDPELYAVIDALPSLDLRDPVTARRDATAFAIASSPPDLGGLEVSNHLIDPTTGVTLRIFRPAAPPDAATGALLYIHGGGFILGSVDTEAANAAALARDLAVVVASVEYRLAPEHRYPAAIDDCTAALHWLHDHADELTIDPRRIVVYGHSAGGALSAALALRSRDGLAPPICFQFLGMPVLDDRLDTPSMRRFVDTAGWNRPSAEISWRHYLGDAADHGAHADAAPARAENLGGLAPAYITAMEFDPLRDEAIAYAGRLLQAGVATELHVFARAFHGSTHAAPDTATARRARAEERVVLSHALSGRPR